MVIGRYLLIICGSIGVVTPLQAQVQVPGTYPYYYNSGYYGGDPYSGIYSANPSLAPMMRPPAPAQGPQQIAPPPMTPDHAGSALPHPMNPDFSRYAPDKFGHVARPKLITTAARGAGIRAGYAEEADRILTRLRQPEIVERLDRRFDFSTLLIDGRILPPVVSELKDMRQAKGDRTIFLTLGSFEIVRPARLVIAIPTWRDYLIDPGIPALAEQEAAPRDAGEQTLWKESYDKGFAVGVAEAQAATSTGFERLARDYAGMQRYRELAASGAVSLPKVATTRRAVSITANGNKAAVQERTIKLVVSPRFQSPRPKAYEARP